MTYRSLRFLAATSITIALLAAACGDDPAEEVAAADAGGGGDATSSDTGSGDTSVAIDAPAPTDAKPDRGSELTGQSCTAPTQCYGGLDAAALKGTVACLAVTNGYCTHECVDDNDCCAVPGECKTGLKQVCSPFTSTGKKYCFLSCEAADLASARDAGIDAGAGATSDDYCKTQGSSEFTCRSTGGGSANRKVCLPGGGGQTDGGAGPDAADAADAAPDAADAGPG